MPNAIHILLNPRSDTVLEMYEYMYKYQVRFYESDVHYTSI